MAAVDPLFAQWLQSDGDHVVRTAAGAAVWGETAVTTERLTGIATKAGAEAEGDRQLAFWARAPFAIELHQVVGTDLADTRGKVINIQIEQLGYNAGLEVFVLEVETDRSTGMSQLTVLRPMGGP